MSGPLLEARALSVSFGGARALRGAAFALRAGEVHALCGENGAGKSTLIRVLTGALPPEAWEGEVLLDGASVRFSCPREALEAGVVSVRQEPALVPGLSAVENALLGALPARGGFVDWEAARAEACALLARLGFTGDPGRPVEGLGAGDRQIVEFAKALRRRPRILLLDEPTSSLSAAQAAALAGEARALRAGGAGIVYISHRLEEILPLADRVTVLRDGAAVSSRAAGDCTAEGLISDMIGRAPGDAYPAPAGAFGAPRLSVRGLRARGPDGRRVEASFEVRRGEVLGIGGLAGSGRSELLLHLYGAWGRREAGEVLLDGEALPPGPPAALIARGLCLVAEDRLAQGLVPGRSALFNLGLGPGGALPGGPLIDEAAERRAGEEDRARFSIRGPSLEAPARAFSGGNQQKLLLARALRPGPRALLLDEPTRGVDVGARAELYRLVRSRAAAGLAVVLVSSDLHELLGLSDRVLVMREGRAAGVFERGAAARRVLAAALGAA